ncbi:MAG: hypothetical protein A2X47_00545 [Lentisphaerae bacterium GWF2_38_69]|nr:MAG: hypothetical protein A2X47_00545 [Lentisphaerae bacterium GWF2_38_69]
MKNRISSIIAALFLMLSISSLCCINAEGSTIDNNFENGIITASSPLITDYVIVHLAKAKGILGGWFMQRQSSSAFTLKSPLPESVWNEYRFVYMTKEGQKETVWFAKDAVAPDQTTPPNDLFPIKIVNKSGKSDNSVYLSMIARLPQNENVMAYLAFDSKTMLPIKVSDNGTSGTCPQYSYQLSRLPKTTDNTYQIYVPRFVSGRLYISIDKPLPFHVNSEPQGLAEPTAAAEGQITSSVGTIYDIVEMTWKPGENLFVNTSNVDFFSIPFGIQMNMTNGTSISRGYNFSRSEIFSKASTLGYPLNNCIVKDSNGQNIRLLGGTIGTLTGKIPANYLNPSIDSAWNNLKVYPVNTTFEGWTVSGYVKKDNLLHAHAAHPAFGSQFFTISKPTSQEVFAGDGTLAKGTEIERKVQAFIAAAGNRGVLHSSSIWWERSKYYKSDSLNKGYYNKYAQLLHSVAAESRCYAFSYDDVNGQESSIWEPNQKELIITIPALEGNNSQTPTANTESGYSNAGDINYKLEKGNISVNSSAITSYIIVHLAKDKNIIGGWFMKSIGNGAYSFVSPISQSRWNTYRFVYMTSQGQKETSWFAK